MSDVPLDQGHVEAGPPVVAVRLSEYELVNLVEGLEAALQTTINTGDWCGALCWRLQAEIKRLGITMQPNQKAAQMIEQAKFRQ